MQSKAQIGLTFPFGADAIVIAINTEYSIDIPQGLNPVIAKNLRDNGLTLTEDGRKIVFPVHHAHGVIVSTDSDLDQLVLRKLSLNVLTESWHRSKLSGKSPNLQTLLQDKFRYHNNLRRLADLFFSNKFLIEFGDFVKKQKEGSFGFFKLTNILGELEFWLWDFATSLVEPTPQEDDAPYMNEDEQSVIAE
jgi:hypothetical protein